MPMRLFLGPLVTVNEYALNFGQVNSRDCSVVKRNPQLAYLMQKLALGQGPERHPAITCHTEKLQLFQGLIFLQCIDSPLQSD